MAQRPISRRGWLAGVMSWSWAAVGCGTWSARTHHVQAPVKGLPPPKMAPDAVSLDVVFLRLDAIAEERLRGVWQEVNEQSIEIGSRRRLDANGIRAAVIHGELPADIARWADEAAARVRDDLMEQTGMAADVPSFVQKLQCRAGRAKELTVRPTRSEPISILRTIDGRVVGKTYTDAALCLQIRTYPKGDGSCRIRLTPEVQYGPFQSTFIVRDAALRRDYQRGRDSWEDLAIEAVLVQRQVLMITGTPARMGVGDPFFWTETAAKTRERVLLLIRLAHTQLDERFAPELTEAASRAAENPL
jgi:hypothetical protein